MQRVLFVCVKDKKSWNIESKDIKNIFFFLEKSWNIESNKIKSQSLIFFFFFSNLWYDTWEYFNYLYIKCIMWHNLILSYMRSMLLLYTNLIYRIALIIMMIGLDIAYYWKLKTLLENNF